MNPISPPGSCLEYARRKSVSVGRSRYGRTEELLQTLTPQIPCARLQHLQFNCQRTAILSLTGDNGLRTSLEHEFRRSVARPCHYPPVAIDSLVAILLQSTPPFSRKN